MPCSAAIARAMSASLTFSYVFMRRVMRSFMSASSANAVTEGVTPFMKLASIALTAPVKTMRAASAGPIETSMDLPKSIVWPSR